MQERASIQESASDQHEIDRRIIKLHRDGLDQTRSNKQVEGEARDNGGKEDGSGVSKWN